MHPLHCLKALHIIILFIPFYVLIIHQSQRNFKWKITTSAAANLSVHFINIINSDDWHCPLAFRTGICYNDKKPYDL